MKFSTQTESISYGTIDVSLAGYDFSVRNREDYPI